MEKISFVGAGSMAEAIIAGLVNKKVLPSEQIYVTNKENDARLQELREKYRIIGTKDKQETIEGADVVIIATKPHDVKEVVLEVKDLITEEQLIVSVVAGIATDFITQTLGKNAPVIRSMPNTSAALGYSATAIAQGTYATDEHIKMAESMFQSIGTVSVVEEEQMHIVTAISGSGPAYIYYLVEAMEKIAIEEGLDEQTAKQLITQTVIGSGKMLEAATEPVHVLRENVTSPNGTTFAGLETLRAYNFEEAIIECVKSAKNRSIELGKK